MQGFGGVEPAQANKSAADKRHRQERTDAHRVIERHDAKRPFAAAVKSDIAEKLSAYQRDFLAYVEGVQKSAAAQKSLSDLFGALEPQMEAFREAVEKMAIETEAAIAADRARTMQIIAGAIIATGLLAGFLAWLIGRAISKPIIALVPILKKLADGDFNVSLPGLGRKDEVGQISEAAELIVERFGGQVWCESEEGRGSTFVIRLPHGNVL